MKYAEFISDTEYTESHAEQYSKFVIQVCNKKLNGSPKFSLINYLYDNENKITTSYNFILNFLLCLLYQTIKIKINNNHIGSFLTFTMCRKHQLILNRYKFLFFFQYIIILFVYLPLICLFNR